MTAPTARELLDWLAKDKSERIRLIERALRDCGQDVTFEAVATQFKRETGETLPSPEQEIPWEK